MPHCLLAAGSSPAFAHALALAALPEPSTQLTACMDSLSSCNACLQTRHTDLLAKRCMWSTSSPHNLLMLEEVCVCKHHMPQPGQSLHEATHMPCRCNSQIVCGNVSYRLCNTLSHLSAWPCPLHRSHCSCPRAQSASGPVCRPLHCTPSTAAHLQQHSRGRDWHSISLHRMPK